MGQKWLMKSEPNVWSIDQQKKMLINDIDSITKYEEEKIKYLVNH